jgi:hypothetical protein
MYRYLDNLHRMLYDMEKEKRRMGHVCSNSHNVMELMDGMIRTFGKVIERNYKKEETEEMPPLLERVLGEDLEERLEKQTLVGGSHSREKGLTFEECYERLLAFKEEFGHVNGVFIFGVVVVDLVLIVLLLLFFCSHHLFVSAVPIRYSDKALANWVSCICTIHFIFRIKAS